MKHLDLRGGHLLGTPYCTIRWDSRRSFLWFVRSELPYRNPAELAREGILVHRTLENAGRPRLLVDLRAVPACHDREIERSMAAFRRKLLVGGNERRAILVKTAVGVLQTQRHVREDGLSVEVFSDEAEAIAHVGAGLSRRPPRMDEVLKAS